MCARGESGGQYLAKHLIRSKGPFDYEVDTWLLFDRENSRIYAMSWEDEKMVGFPGKDFYVSAGIIPPTLPQVADNGTVAYSINSDEIPAHQRGGRPSQARVIADISGNRKYVIPVISWSAEFYPSVKLAGDGSSARIQSKHYENRHFVLDIKGGTLTEKRE